MDKANMEARLTSLRNELQNVKGTRTEVYSRIVGYYRSVKNWNAGKRSEYANRKLYSVPDGLGGTVPSAAARLREAATRDHAAPGLAEPRGKPSDYLLFVRTSCPNCPPVRSYLAQSGLPGRIVDVDTEDGLSLAMSHNVLASPTALVRGTGGVEVYRACTVTELRAFLVPAAGARASVSV